MSEKSNILAELHILACACESGHSIDEWRNDFHHGIKGAMSELARLRKAIEKHRETITLRDEMFADYDRELYNALERE